MRRNKIIAVIAAVILIPVLILLFVFSKPGNNMLIKPYAQGMLDEKVAIPTTIETLRISLGSFQLALSMQDGSTITAEGDYSLFAQSVDGKYRVAIKELANLEKLIGQKLNGALNITGNVKGSADDLHIAGNTDIFKSQTTYDVKVIDQKPQKIIVHLKDGQINHALHMANQPAFASGMMNIDADLTPKDASQISGNVVATITQGTLNAPLLKEKHNIDLPTGVKFSLAAKSQIDGDNTQSTLHLDSDILLAKIEKALFNLKTQSIQSDFWVKVLNITLPQIDMQEPIELSGQIEGDMKNMTVDANTGIFNSHSTLGVTLAEFQPVSAQYDLKEINLDKVLKFVRQPEYAKGQVSIKGSTREINLESMAFATDTQINAAIQSINHPSFKLDQAFTLQSQLKGTSKNLAVTSQSDIFGSETKADVTVANLEPKKVTFDISKLAIGTIISTLKLPTYASGMIQAKGNITDLDPKNLAGKADIETSKLVLDHKVLNKEFGLKLKSNIPAAFKTSANMAQGSVTANSAITSSLANLTAKKTTVQVQKQHITTDYLINVPDLSKLEPLIEQKLVGKLDVNGEIKKSEKLYATAKSNTLGGSIDFKLDDQKIDLHTKDLKVTELVKMINQPSLVTEGTMQLDAKLDKLNLMGEESEMFKELTGPVNFYASGIKVKNYDVDKIIEQFQKSKKVDLVDIGAFAVAGPLGALLTKGTDTAGIAGGFSKGASSLIKEIRADIDIKKGLANAQDIALSTKKNRVAIKGGIDLPTKAFKDFSLAILNKEGCADFKQNVGGTLDNPQVSGVEAAVNVVGSLLGSFIKPVKSAVNAKCSAYYTGKVKHPN